jgi:hypothetical protein
MWLERLLLLSAWGIALSALSFGWHLSTVFHDPHWLNRAGAVVVAGEALVFIVERQRSRRVRELTKATKNRYIEEYNEANERILGLVSAAFAIAGEIFHGFGDLLFEWLAGS